MTPAEAGTEPLEDTMSMLSSDPTYMLVIARQHQEALRRAAEQGRSPIARTERRPGRLSTLVSGVRPSWHLPRVLHHVGHSRPA
jgi:hypothetical protein